MNAISCRTRITANRVVHFVAAGSGVTIASLFFLAPSASAAPFKICEMEQGPNGPQCVQEPKQAELCQLDKNLKCVQPPKQVELCELGQGPNGPQCVQQPKQAELCDLEMGPNGLQCVEDQLDEKAPEPGPDPEPPVDPEPQSEPGVGDAPDPKVAPGFEAQEPKAEAPVVPEVVDSVPDIEIAASPSVENPEESYARWAGLALLGFGLLWFYARRRRQAQDDAVTPERM